MSRTSGDATDASGLPRSSALQIELDEIYNSTDDITSIQKSQRQSRDFTSNLVFCKTVKVLLTTFDTVQTSDRDKRNCSQATLALHHHNECASLHEVTLQELSGWAQRFIR